jgi:hypothetical protein
VHYIREGVFIVFASESSNQSMKPSAPLGNKFNVIAITPCRGLFLSL